MINPVHVTSSAIEAVKKIAKEKNIPSEYDLRIGRNQGPGCRASDFVLGFDKRIDNDLEVLMDGLKVIIKKSDVLFLNGIVLDYITRNGETGFIFYHENKGLAPKGEGNT